MESPAFIWRFDQLRQVLQLRQDECRNLSSFDVQRVFGVRDPIAALLSVEHIWTLIFTLLVTSLLVPIRIVLWTNLPSSHA